MQSLSTHRIRQLKSFVTPLRFNTRHELTLPSCGDASHRRLVIHNLQRSQFTSDIKQPISVRTIKRVCNSGSDIPPLRHAELYVPFAPALNPHFDDASALTLREARERLIVPGVNQTKVEDTVTTVCRFLTRVAPHVPDPQRLSIGAGLWICFFIFDDAIDDQNDPRMDVHALLSAFRSAVMGVAVDDEVNSLAYLCIPWFVHLMGELEKSVGVQTEDMITFRNETLRYIDAVAWKHQHVGRGNSIDTPSLEEVIAERFYSCIAPLGIRLTTLLMPTDHHCDDVKGADASAKRQSLAEAALHAAVNQIMFTNDLASLNKELASNCAHDNSVWLIAQKQNSCMRTARDQVIEWANDASMEFVRLEKSALRAGADPVFLQAMATFIRGHLDWLFETSRYGLQRLNNSQPTLE